MKTFIPSSMSQLPKAMAFVRSEAISTGFSEKDTWKIELPVEEALTNIIRHGQSEEGIEIDFSRSEPIGLTVTIKDWGKPFDPSASIPTTEQSAIGGNGIALMQKCIDVIRYQRHDNYNLLTLTKLL